jgi:spore germination cell wall hydrolase CwlJ-like protein
VRPGHRRSNVRWACDTAAPWALAAGWLVSFTASAGHGLQSGFSAVLPAATAPVLVGSLIPSSAARLGASPALPQLELNRLVREARLHFDLPDETDQLLATFPPRSDLKAGVGGYPAVDRSRKGDPIVNLRPTLSRRGTDLQQGATTAATRVLFGSHERDLASPFIPGRADPLDLSAEPGFAPWQGPDPTTTRAARSVQSPAAASGGATGSGRGAVTPSAGGATPAVPRAVALSSTTPAPADATPIEIAAAPVSSPYMSHRLDRGGKATSVIARDAAERPNYAGLVNQDNLNREQRCLAEAVYFEARSEPEEGQAAVAQVILNRVKSGLYPSSICGVVYQNRHRHLACQFTFACEGKSLRISDQDSWQRASRIAKAVLEGKTYLADVGAATHYHADYVRPRWAKRLKKMDVIGRHIFYKLRPGQT